MKSLNNIKICVFDAYGTLFDVHSASEKYKDEIGELYNEFSILWRAKQLEYSFLSEIMDDYTDFIDITANSLDYACNTFKITSDKLKINLMSSYMELSPYSEVIKTLLKFKEKGLKLVILTNGSYKMINNAVESSGLKNILDSVISVEEVKKFKPNKEVYKIITDKFNVNLKEVVFFSSNGWDIIGASKFGFNTIWINRFNKETEISKYTPDYIVSNLKEALNLFE
ncbi:haloacid dehalogenase type II [Clostridium thermobutyricum]|uniref:(S)-2-haloacid dehalogenase 4A n=1 Tax=Clostridium thermobutyricum DSM 4928 TaxID=1121339 RepID=A0A1V4SLI6_9CLOT|nr:haloacid dehalogenase type II [Clostridium thermobutyricum]OPX44728.1 (S)-2-haloacid dehalogenase 4A [Clostridium thermobutyricum DSM 4928]